MTKVESHHLGAAEATSIEKAQESGVPPAAGSPGIAALEECGQLTLREGAAFRNAAPPNGFDGARPRHLLGGHEAQFETRLEHAPERGQHPVRRCRREGFGHPLDQEVHRPDRDTDRMRGQCAARAG